MRFLKAGAVLAAVTLAGALAACSSSSPSGGGGGASSGGSNATLTISNENGALWTCDFSPFNGSDTLLSVGFVYETLDYINPLQDGKITPMLASSYSWGAGDKSLTFTIRQGVKFSNGTPLSAKDVAYTFSLLKKYPALDLTGVWSVLSSVTQTGADQVTLDFSAPAVPWFYYIADQVPIVSEAIWSKVANPVPRLASRRHRAVPGQPVHLGQHHLHRQPGLLAGGRAARQEDRVPGVHQQQHRQRRARHRPGPVGGAVHPQHHVVLHRQEPGLPLLVPADGERVAGAEPDQPAAEQREGPPGDLLRDRPVAGLLSRRVRL
jgi:hypothetical protein